MGRRHAGGRNRLYDRSAWRPRGALGRGPYAKEGKPFFLDVHFNAPHWPWEGPADEAEAERLRDKAIRDFDGGTQRTYKAMVERMDFQIGRVLAALDRLGLAENTIVAFTSDNGGERFADTWPFTGRKTELLEGGLRVPMVMRWPAKVAGRQVSDQVAISMDWMPTFLAAAGVPWIPARQRMNEPAAANGPGCPAGVATAVLALQGEPATGRAGR